MSVLKLMMIMPMYARFLMLRRRLMKLTGQTIDCYLLSFLILRVTLAYLAYISMSCLTQERGRRTISMKQRWLNFGRWALNARNVVLRCVAILCTLLGSYTFDLIIYNDLLAGDETISITANEIPSTYAVLLGRKTIKQNKISLKCFHFFSNLETCESLSGFVSYNLYATSPKSHLCSATFNAPAAVAKPQAIVDCRGGKETERPKERFLTPEPDEDFVDPTDEYKVPWEEDTPLPEGVRSKAGNASSCAASIGLEISGSEEFVTDVCALMLEFRDIFSTELSPEPADLPPLDVPIDTAK